MQSPHAPSDSLELPESLTSSSLPSKPHPFPESLPSHPLHRHADQLISLVQRTLTILLSYTPQSTAVQPGLKKAISGSLREAQILHRAFQEMMDEEDMSESAVDAEIERLEMECVLKEELLDEVKKEILTWRV
jgi:hypothetical protein